MKKRTLLLLVIGAAIAISPIAFNFVKTNAQTTVAKPTPPPSPEPTVDDDPGVITIDTELVNLNVRVVDRNNRSITNLTEKDFSVFEDNVKQRIEFFSKSEVPTNYVMVIDNSGSMRLQLDKVIEASKIIVRTNRSDDETSIIRFVDSDKIEVTQDFSPNKDEIMESLDNLFIEGGPTAIIDAVYLAAQNVDEYERTKSGNDRKRRALILVSDGEDRDSFYKEQQLFEMLRESDVQIFAVGFVNELSKEGGLIRKSPQATAKAFLERLAKETGGKVYFPNSLSELNGIAMDIASELRTQYSIGYLPDNDKKDNAFRSIKVAVSDGPNKEKRIAITRTGIQTRKPGESPNLQTPKKPGQ